MVRVEPQNHTDPAEPAEPTGPINGGISTIEAPVNTPAKAPPRTPSRRSHPAMGPIARTSSTPDDARIAAQDTNGGPSVRSHAKSRAAFWLVAVTRCEGGCTYAPSP